ncbi:hypothetical protein JOS77_08460 [Chromobacterium haemolyticum]|nr:hypothetical protein JOS77_08460 [Chromobacterium haemolyticum]
MEDIVGGWWDKLAQRAARRGFPECAVELAQVTAQAPLFFRAMGGDPALALRSTVGTEHGARRGWLQRLAGTGSRVELAWRDSQVLSICRNASTTFPARLSTATATSGCWPKPLTLPAAMATG